ncbi:hypothetical protein [Priestia megaterium]|nr:hypothetical protein [Priestia megaterium]
MKTPARKVKPGTEINSGVKSDSYGLIDPIVRFSIGPLSLGFNHFSSFK